MTIIIRRYWRLLTNYLTPQWRQVAQLALLLVGGTLLQLAPPQFLRRFLDTALADAAAPALPWLAMGFILLALGAQLAKALTAYVGELVGWSATNQLRADLVAHCLRLDLAFHKDRTPGEMVERIDGDVTALSGFFSRMAIDIIGNLLLLVGVLAALFWEDWRAGLALSLFAAVTLYVLWQVRSWAAPIWVKTRQAWAEFYGFLGEQLAGTEAIRASGAESYVMHRFYQQLRQVSWTAIRSAMTYCMMWGSSITIFAAGNAITLGIGAYLYGQGGMTLGTVYLLFHYTQLLNRPLEAIRTQMQELQKAGASIDRVGELLAAAPAIVDGPGAPLAPGSLPLTFEDVTFAYEDGQPVLAGLSLRLAPGQVLGVLGRTGSGKSTLARLLLRFYDPGAGAILLGDAPMTQLTREQIRSRVGFVTQDVQLFAASVRDNLTFFDPSIADERIAAILGELGLGPWLRRLPRGLDTLLESGDGGLSAGEAQLLAFARVFLHDPGLVILDEASSRLDPATEMLVERAVDRLLMGRTGIIIAHRLSTVQRADQILILEQGAVLELGERRQLERDPRSRFAELLRTGLREEVTA